MAASQQFWSLDPERSAELIDAAGSDHFPALLLSIAHDLGGADEVFGYSLTAGSNPCVLVSCSTLPDSDKRVEQYSRRFFHHDPVLPHQGQDSTQGCFRQQVRGSDIRVGDYRRLCFDQPGFVDKLSFGWRKPDRITMLSFYRRTDQDEMADIKLGSLAEVALTALNRKQRPLTETAFIEKLERRLQRSFPQLTNREMQTCARTIAGWSAERIARELGLRASSVLTYRQRAYTRSDCSSSHSFLPALID